MTGRRYIFKHRSPEINAIFMSYFPENVDFFDQKHHRTCNIALIEHYLPGMNETCRERAFKTLRQLKRLDRIIAA